jgi:Exopolysaccharide biosynthesis protein YbjH
MMNRRAKLLLGGAVSAAACLCAAFAFAESRVSVSMLGVPGLIDMPSGEAMPDGTLTLSLGKFGPITRTSLSFQITPRLSASFRSVAVENWDDVVPATDSSYSDRSFDLRYQIITEGAVRPAVTLGFSDLFGIGLQSGEYLVATKNLGNGLKVTAGLGWGRYASGGGIGTLFGDRAPTDLGTDGENALGQWFKGEAAPFAGVEWQINERWGFKAEYSSDAYVIESGERQTFDRKSPFNFGIEYQPTQNLRLGAYSLYGSEIGLLAQFVIDPRIRPSGGVVGSAPRAVERRPSFASNPEAWSPDWVDQPGVAEVLRTNLEARLRDDGLIVEALSYTARDVHLRIRNTKLDSEAQAIGRAARALSQVMPASVETFAIVPVANGIGAAQVTLQRSDIEGLEYAPDNGTAIGERAVLSWAGAMPAGAVYGEGLYPKFHWSLLPYLSTSVLAPNTPLRADVGLRLSASYDVQPGLVVSATLTHKLAGNLSDGAGSAGTSLPAVRTDADKYSAEGVTALESLTFAWYSEPAPNLYGRVTAGYLERMFGGVSAELLWKRPDSPLALGVEVNYVQQRDFDQRFGFQDYTIVTGHVSAYYSFGDGYNAQVDVGRYLAGDWGATVSLDREFGNGWRIGAFATKTDATDTELGSGAFERGVRLTIPVNWVTGKATRNSFGATIRPSAGDSGARLDVGGRLFDSIRDYHDPVLDQQWGRFWR